jgi:hypothetical protein
MKRYTMVGATISLALFSSVALAAPNIVNTTQKGSLLIFPEIDVEESTNTIIRLTNDGTKSIDVKCYYGEFTDDIYNKPIRDIRFELTKNHPVYWEAKDGTGSIKGVFEFPTEGSKNAGQLICWAVAEVNAAVGYTQVKWNHLSGTATVVDTADNVAFSYNAYQFYARGAKNKKQVGTTRGVLELDGTAAGGGYDKCARYVIGHFAPLDAVIKLPGNDVKAVENTLSISTCTQDLIPVGASDSAKPLGPDKTDPFNCDDDPNTAAPECGQTIVIDVWNADEVKQTSASELADSWWRMSLGDKQDEFSEIDSFPQAFTFDSLQTNSAYFRAQSENGYGLVGVLVTELDNKDVAGEQEMKFAVTLNHAGNRAGMIKWDPEGPTDEKM